jgi:predicted membrane metal-binding protein
MKALQRKSGWQWIALVAVGIALLALLVPHVHDTDSGVWTAILPLLFVGIISPLSLLSPLAYLYLGRSPNAPALPLIFQRPPPFDLA